MKTLIHKNLEWGNPSKEPMDWDEAIEYCESLGKGWRLPTIKELQSIMSYKKRKPALKKKFIKQFSVVVSCTYWSSTTSVNTMNYAWYMYMGLGYGSIGNDSKTSRYYIWPVRELK